MTARDPVLDALMRQAVEKRLAGRSDEALQLVNALLRRNPGHAGVRDEAMRTLIVAGQAQRAFQLLGTAAEAGVDGPPAADIAARLALDLGLDVPLIGLAAAGGPRWLAGLSSDGHEPREEMLVRSLRVAARGGRLIYTFAGTCPYCTHVQTLRLTSTLLTRRSWLCPACLGRLGFDHETARRHIAARHGHLLGRTFAQLEAPVAQRVRQRVIGETPSPAIVDGLGQGYQFLLNEMILRLALADGYAAQDPSDASRPGGAA